LPLEPPRVLDEFSQQQRDRILKAKARQRRRKCNCRGKDNQQGVKKPIKFSDKRKGPRKKVLRQASSRVRKGKKRESQRLQGEEEDSKRQPLESQGLRGSPSFLEKTPAKVVPEPKKRRVLEGLRKQTRIIVPLTRRGGET